jgi:hypothetical protein
MHVSILARPEGRAPRRPSRSCGVSESVPEIGSVSGDPGCYLERLETLVREQGIALEYSADIAPAKGTSEGGKITSLPGQSMAEAVATLAHEMMHHDERRTGTSKCSRETELGLSQPDTSVVPTLSN